MNIWIASYVYNGIETQIGAYESKEDAMAWFDTTVRALGYDPATVSDDDIAIGDYDRDDGMGYAWLHEDESYLSDWTQITVQPCTTIPPTNRKKMEETKQ